MLKMPSLIFLNVTFQCVILFLTTGCESVRPQEPGRDAFVPMTIDSRTPSDMDFSVPMDMEVEPAADAQPPALDGGPVGDASLSPADQGSVTADMVAPEPELEWRRRDCGLWIRHWAAPGIRRVQLAGEFTCRRPGECWADGAIDMERVEDSHQQNEDPCAQGGPCLYQTYLEPNQYLRSERIYGYKLIETTQAGQSTWRMHPDASLHTMVDACLNSGLQLPACDAGPELEIMRVDHEEGSASLGLSAFIELSQTARASTP